MIPTASVHALPRRSANGATALGSDPTTGSPPTHDQRHLVGNAVRAVKVFAVAVFSVVVMGEYAEG
ncbi:hypothetical protein GCM10009864_77710 [Streptomyces lunalinharesii]|uniref:Uncharacterized protein n=2 Tax=Streptomyces lunalinharesii TaxID=333384 RepID=A0ABN3T4B1_9ACTN